MRRTPLYTTILIVLAMTTAHAQAQSAQSANPGGGNASAEVNLFRPKATRGTPRAGIRLMPPDAYSVVAPSSLNLAATNPVGGSGTPGRIARWSGVFGTNTYTLGDSAITEDKFGKIGIGTTNPTSPLTVVGLIESMNPAGGIKFPDGTIQTTSATGALFSIPHDATLMGNGTAGSPLGVAVPLTLSGVVPGLGLSILEVSNTADGGNGVRSFGGDSMIAGGSGVAARGGDSDGSGGAGVRALGGTGDTRGGVGLKGTGGTSGGVGGAGVSGDGGQGSFGGNGGTGVEADGGDSDSEFGGNGLVASPGLGALGIGLAGEFQGDVAVMGMLSKGGGSFKIDHPLDPENRYLLHSFVESPDMKNIYDGNVVTDAGGEATVELPAYFEALNRDFRYQLTVVGTFAQAIVGEEIKDNRFVIRTSSPNVKVSWQVTGIRQDGWANRNRIRVEVEKTGRERGHYLHPEAFNQPEERGIVWARNPEMMQQRKAARERAEPKQR